MRNPASLAATGIRPYHSRDPSRETPMRPRPSVLLLLGLVTTFRLVGPLHAFAARDKLNRDAIFDPEVDKVWAQVERLVGAETGAKMREILRNQEVENI